MEVKDPHVYYMCITCTFPDIVWVYVVYSVILLKKMCSVLGGKSIDRGMFTPFNFNAADKRGIMFTIPCPSVHLLDRPLVHHFFLFTDILFIVIVSTVITFTII